jgi:hypothetical protein
VDPGELLFARVLMPDFLAGRGPTQWDIRAPDRMLAELGAGIRSYLKGRSADLPNIDTAYAFDLPEAIPPESFGAVERLPPDLVVTFVLTAQRALAYLQQLVPVRKLPGLASRDADMTAAEKARLRRAAQAVEDPIRCLQAPEALSGDHVDAIRAVYPALFAEAARLSGEAISTLTRPLRAREDAALSRLLGLPARAMAILAGPDQTQAGADPSGRPSRGPPVKAPDMRPATERLAAR